MSVKPSWFLELHLLGYLVICAGCITFLLNKYTVHLLALNFCRRWCYFVLLLMRWHVGAFIWIWHIPSEIFVCSDFFSFVHFRFGP
jgi:hypothetical protein